MSAPIALRDPPWAVRLPRRKEDVVDDLVASLRCGSDLERGVIVGQQLYLNWEPTGASGGVTMHGEEHLAKGTVDACTPHRCGAVPLVRTGILPGHRRRLTAHIGTYVRAGVSVRRIDGTATVGTPWV